VLDPIADISAFAETSATPSLLAVFNNIRGSRVLWRCPSGMQFVVHEHESLECWLRKGGSGMETNFTMLQGAETNPARAHHGSTFVLRSGAIPARGLHTKLALVLVLITGIFVGVSSAGAEQMPSGTIELSGGSVAAGVGYTWGNGTLIFEGKKYPIKVQGLSIVHVGVSDYTASGTVYNLKKLSDIDGVYTAVSAGAALAGGASATAMENSHGVVIQMVATHAGVNLSLGPKGMVVNL
jgi:hypothetical protein